MRVLAIETSTAWGSVAITDAGGVVAERSADVPGQHLEWLVSAIDAMLTEARLDRTSVDGLAVSIGPGRFNGLRIGLATASAWAATAGRPLAGVSTLDTIAAGTSVEPAGVEPAGAKPAAGALVLAVLDVRRGEVAAALYRRVEGLARLTANVVAPPDRLRDALPPITEPLIVAGDGLERHQAAVLEALAPWAAPAAPEQWRPRASVVGMLGRSRLVRGDHDDPLTLVPVYARPVDAREYAR